MSDRSSTTFWYGHGDWVMITLHHQSKEVVLMTKAGAVRALPLGTDFAEAEKSVGRWVIENKDPNMRGYSTKGLVG